MLKVFWRVVLITLALLLLWRVVTIGLGEHYAEQASLGDEGAALQALAWNPSEGKAALIKSQMIGENNLASVTDALTTALVNDPTNTRALVALSKAAQEQGDAKKADELINLSTRLAPVDPVIRHAAAVNWVEQGDLTKAVENLSAALSADSSRFNALFPTLLKIAEDDRLRGVLAPYAEQGAPWWERFFTQVARQAVNVDTVKAMVAMRRGNSTGGPLTDQEQSAYVSRLYKEGLVAEAYLAWVNGLDQAQKDHLGLIYDGGFETEFVKGTGFDWFVRARDGVLVQRSVGFGTEGGQALHLAFRNFDAVLRSPRQWLFLDAGSYRLSGRVRPDGLKTSGGIQWVVTCTVESRARRLAETERFLGSDQWRSFEMDFDVPEECLRLQVQLVSVTRTRADRRINGSIWFDDLRIQRLSL